MGLFNQSQNSATLCGHIPCGSGDKAFFVNHVIDKFRD